MFPCLGAPLGLSSLVGFTAPHKLPKNMAVGMIIK
jgi:hypothetical protein